jgi:hypothetical protein
VFDLLRSSDWWKVKFACFFSLAYEFERTFSFALRRLVGLLFIFAFVERVDWVDICMFIDLIFVFSLA